MPPVDLTKVTHLLNHGPTTLITTAHAGKRNIMAAAWVCALDFNPDFPLGLEMTTQNILMDFLCKF